MVQLRVFSGNSNLPLAREICGHIGIQLSPLEISRFSNDNYFVRVMTNVRERDVFVIQSFTAPVSNHIMELFIIMDALRSASARRITAVIPYFSYARSDKKDAPRISITGRLMADLIKAAGADRVLTMDLHSDAVHGFFSMPVDHLTAIPLIAGHLKQTMDLSRVVAVATDAGGAKRVGKFAAHLDVPMAIIDKRRLGDDKVAQGLVVGDVKGKDAIIFDDEISTGGTLVSTARTLINAGVKSMVMGATHPVLCGNAPANLADSKVGRFVVSNTVHVDKGKQIDRLEVISVAPVMAEAIKRIHSGESVGALFDT
jgi:ribose-phosphate pyrophosphokinase